MTNNMALSGLRENVILTKIIPTIGGTTDDVKSGTWCQRAVGPHLVQDSTYNFCWCNTSCVAPSLLWQKEVWAKCGE